MTESDLSAELQRIDEENEYYAITLLGKDEGTIEWSCYSHWTGWVEDGPPHEMRAASLVHADRMAAQWDEIDEYYLVVNSSGALAVFLRVGGHALIERGVAEEYLPEVIEPQPVAPDGALGFKTLDSFPEAARKRAPTPKHRMRILNRDGRRCRLCGRSADDHVDIELHVHHIRPFAMGGLTEDRNLITLCHTCHNGLDPHFDRSLFELTGGGLDEALGLSQERYYRRVLNYRKGVRKQLEDADRADGT